MYMFQCTNNREDGAEGYAPFDDMSFDGFYGLQLSKTGKCLIDANPAEIYWPFPIGSYSEEYQNNIPLPLPYETCKQLDLWLRIPTNIISPMAQTNNLRIGKYIFQFFLFCCI